MLIIQHKEKNIKADLRKDTSEISKISNQLSQNNRAEDGDGIIV